MLINFPEVVKNTIPEITEIPVLPESVIEFISEIKIENEYSQKPINNKQ